MKPTIWPRRRTPETGQDYVVARTVEQVKRKAKNETSRGPGACLEEDPRYSKEIFLWSKSLLMMMIQNFIT